MVTPPVVFREIDLYTVKVEDLQFSVPFTVKCNRDDYVHAFVVYFDTYFNACHKPIVFGTGPQDKYTHWKQVRYTFGLTVVDGVLFASAPGCWRRR